MEEERKVSDMGNTVILTVFFPVIIAGMILVITWSMNAAGSAGNALRHGPSERHHDL
jgi:hypothetical protein